MDPAKPLRCTSARKLVPSDHRGKRTQNPVVLRRPRHASRVALALGRHSTRQCSHPWPHGAERSTSRPAEYASSGPQPSHRKPLRPVFMRTPIEPEILAEPPQVIASMPVVRPVHVKTRDLTQTNRLRGTREWYAVRSIRYVVGSGRADGMGVSPVPGKTPGDTPVPGEELSRGTSCGGNANLDARFPANLY